MLDSTPEQRVVLQSCSWETYERILGDQADRRSPRFTFSEGMLEIMSPSPEHERAREILKQIVYLACDMAGREVDGLGCTTIRRRALNRGIEADAWFYFDRFGCDPETEPPDLAIEVEVSQSALDKLPILAAIGVPELWRTDLRSVTIYRLRSGTYELCEQSGFLPTTAANLSRLLVARADQSRVIWLQTARELLGQ